jgi:hypothetical protein
MNMKVDVVMMILQFEGFTAAYESEFMAINSKKD